MLIAPTIKEKICALGRAQKFPGEGTNFSSNTPIFLLFRCKIISFSKLQLTCILSLFSTPNNDYFRC